MHSITRGRKRFALTARRVSGLWYIFWLRSCVDSVLRRVAHAASVPMTAHPRVLVSCPMVSTEMGAPATSPLPCII